MKKRWLFALPAFILLVTLTSCDSVVIETRTTTPLIGLQATFAINQTKNANYSATQAAINTQIVLNRNLTITTRPTSTPRPTPFPFQTPERGEFHFEEYSPNLEWGVRETYSSTNGNSMIVVYLSNPNIIWTITQYDKTNSGWVVDYGYSPIHWSIDGKYLYFTINWVGRDGWAAYIGYSYFKRLDLKSGNLIDILPPEGEYQVGISPDSKYLAYLKHLDLTIRDLTNGEEESLFVSGFANISSGDIRWSPDSSKLIFVMQNSDNWAIILVDREEIVYQVLLEQEDEIYIGVWINDFEIKVYPSKDIINIQTGEITEMEE